MHTVLEYLMGRDKLYPEEFHDNRVWENAQELLSRTNPFWASLNLSPQIRSGYRPAFINRRVGGSKKSTHIYGMGCDFADPKGDLKEAIAAAPERLKIYNLWMEDPAFTPTWVHLDIATRSERPVRIFKP